MMPWIVLFAIGLGFGALRLAAAVFTFNIHGIVGSSIGLALGAHFFMVVESYKEEVNGGVEGGRVVVAGYSTLPTYKEAVQPAPL